MQVASVVQAAEPVDPLLGDRHEFIEWAEPIIADRVFDFYSVATEEREADAMAVRHCQLWRSVILAQSASVAVSRKDLRRLGTALGLPLAFMDAVDQEVMEELLDVVLTRYGASRSKSKRFSLILMAVANDLGAARATARATAH